MQPQITESNSVALETEPPPRSSEADCNMDERASRTRTFKWQRSGILAMLIVVVGALTACSGKECTHLIVDDNKVQAVIMLSEDPKNPGRLQQRLVVRASSKEDAKAKRDEIVSRLRLSQIGAEASTTPTGALLVRAANAQSNDQCQQRNGAGDCMCDWWDYTNCCSCD